MDIASIRVWMKLKDALIDVKTIKLNVPNQVQDGGVGSGNFGHSGRPGEVGGSSSEGGGGGNVHTPSTFKKAKPKPFRDALISAKESNKDLDRWRVEVKDESEYNDCKLFVSDGGSTVAIKPDGDIVSVCKHQGSTEKGSELLAKAVAEGGDRLDAFGRGLFTFYTRNGFEPISRVDFSEPYAPPDWVKGRDKHEPVIFYKYVGKGNVKNVLYSSFMKSTKAMPEYDDAQKQRDLSIGQN